MTAAAVSAEAVVRRHPGGRGVGPVDLAVAPGETVAVMGPNGAGKTTLLRVLATVDRPQSGTVRWWGGRHAPAVRSRLGLALDSPVEEETLSGRQSTHFWCRQWVADGARAFELVDAALERFGLTAVADEPVGGYSFGMRRRLALAQALAHRPELALLDEPTAGLDPEGAAALVEALGDRRAAGLATFVATNDPPFVQATAGRVAVLVDGRLAACATPAELLAAVAATRVVELSLGAPLDAAELASLPGVVRAAAHVGGAVVEIDAGGSLPALVAAVEAVPGRLRDLRVREPDLRDSLRVLAERAGAPEAPA